MSRVEEQQRKSTAEAERLQKQADRATRDQQRSATDRQRFGQLMQAKPGAEKTPPAPRGQLARQEQHAVTQQGREAQDLARQARLARGGTLQHGRILEQVKSFQGTLQGQRVQSQEAQQGRTERREEGLAETRQQGTERATDLEQRRETRAELDREQARAEAYAEGKATAAIEGRSRGRQSSSGEGDTPRDGEALGRIRSEPAISPLEGAQASREVQQIPDAILEALADQVYIGVNAEGLAEFRVELKEGILQGATLRVVAGDRGVRLSFDGLEGNARRLILASEGDLGRRLRAKGMRLEELSV